MHTAWWKEAVVYQIYPRSFMDSNGDGIGDLQGIMAKLDYLQELGVDVVWLSPVYKSPNDDNGYDISDYLGIMDEFGTMADWEQLLAGLHERGMKLMMDLVVNHSSDEHAWFMEARKSKHNPYRDYYFWREGQGGKKPNNWVSLFGGSAWEFDQESGEYYLHLFSRKQPDLNWDNPRLRQDVYDMMTWWLDKGVDGFRMDVINMISKAEGLPSVPTPEDGGYAWGGAYFMNGPHVHDYLREMNERVLSRYDMMTVGETPGATTGEAARYASLDGSELNMIFQFEHMELDSGPTGKWELKPWRLQALKAVMSKWQKELEGKAWNSLYLNNHDQPRMVSRFGNEGEYRVPSAKMLATMLHFMQGTPYIYQGEELGMTNVRFATIDDYSDLETLHMYRERVGGGADPGAVMLSIYAKGRDNARTPMQWSAAPNAGFTSGKPWLAVNPNYTDINAAAARADSGSIYHYYRQLITLRKKHPIIVHGTYDLLLPDHERVYAYTRTLGSERLLVLLNFFAEPATIDVPAEQRPSGGAKLIGNYEEDVVAQASSVALRPYEAAVYRFGGE